METLEILKTALMQLQYVNLFQFMLIYLGIQIKCIPSSIVVIAAAVTEHSIIFHKTYMFSCPTKDT